MTNTVRLSNNGGPVSNCRLMSHHKSERTNNIMVKEKKPILNKNKHYACAILFFYKDFMLNIYIF